MTAAREGEEAVYTVGHGDSLWEIARRFGTSVAALRATNGLTSSQIHPGQELKVHPAAAGGTEGEVALQAYLVRRGDSLWKIAREHRTTVARLKRVNDPVGPCDLPRAAPESPGLPVALAHVVG